MCRSTSTRAFVSRVGERYGNVWGHKFVTELLAASRAISSRGAATARSGRRTTRDSSSGSAQGNSYKDGLTKNLYQSMTGGCIVNGVVSGAIQGIKNCATAGGKVNTPWGQRQVHWGMPTAVRDSNGAESQQLLGNSMPLWKIGWSHNMQFKRINAYVLLDKTFGNRVYNTDRHWSFGDFMTSDAQQDGKSVENAKPIGYYWRAAAPEAATGIGGYYDVLGPNTISYEDGSYTKLRELSLSYNVGTIKHVIGQLERHRGRPQPVHVDEVHGLGSGHGRRRRTGPVGRALLDAVLELPADAQLHVDALLQVLTSIGGPVRDNRSAQAMHRDSRRKDEGDSHYSYRRRCWR